MLGRIESRMTVLVVFLAATAGFALAQDTWNGGSGNWSDPNYWSTGTVPNSPAAVVYIDGGNAVNSNVNLDLSNVDVGSLTLDADDTLGIYGGLTIHVSADISGTIYSGGTLNNDSLGVFNYYGTFNNWGGTFNNSSAFLWNYGRFYNSFGGKLNNDSGGWFFNSGTIYSGAVNNYGVFYNDSGATATGFVNNTGTIENFGNLNGGLTNNSGVVNNSIVFNGDLTNNSGTLNNLGVFNGNIVNNFGIVNNSGMFNGDVTYTYGTFNNLGTLNESCCSFVKSAGTLNNYGTININSFLQSLTIQNGGSMTNYSGGVVNNNGSVYNYSTFNNAGIINNMSSGYVLNTGTLNNYFGAAINNSSGAWMEIDGTLNNYGTINNYGALDGSGQISNYAGAVWNILGNGGQVNIAALLNNGTVVIGTGANLYLTYQPNGITDVAAGSTFDLAGTFNARGNEGFYQLTSVEGNLILENGQTTTSTPIGGTFTVGSTGYVEVKTGTTFDITGNVVVNSGGILSINDPMPTTVNITGALTNLGGQVNLVGPNAFLNAGSIGNGGMMTLPEGSTTTLTGGFYQLAKGTLGESMGAAGIAIIMVNGGLVALDGTLDVLLDPGYNPAVGSMFKFLLFNSGALSGQFASIQNDIFNGGTEKWAVIYNDAGGYVELMAQSNNQPTPEPSSFFLLGTGLLGVFYGIRRRLSK